MPEVFFQSTTNFPQTSNNRTRLQAENELCDFLGGGNRGEMRAMAGRMWDAAVREYNDVCWKFNRMQQDITLVADTKEYELNSDFRSPLRAQLLDSNSVGQQDLIWLPHHDWLRYFAGGSSGAGIPDYYTALNIHLTGLVRFEPWPMGTLGYPTAKITYFRRIVPASAESDVLNVPMEVDEAIFQLARAKMVHAKDGGDKAATDYLVAQRMKEEVRREWRDWPEENSWGGY